MAKIDFYIKPEGDGRGLVSLNLVVDAFGVFKRQAEHAMAEMEASFMLQLARRDERIARLEGLVAGHDRGVALRSVRR